MPGDASGVVTRLEQGAVGRDAEAGRDFDCDQVGGEQILAAAIEKFGEAQRTREGGGARMYRPAWMRIVVIEPVREYAVHDHGVFQRQSGAHADD